MQIKNDYMSDDDGNIKYNEMCVNCKYKCKQSYKSTIMSCPKIIDEKNNKKNKIKES